MSVDVNCGAVELPNVGLSIRPERGVIEERMLGLDVRCVWRDGFGRRLRWRPQIHPAVASRLRPARGLGLGGRCTVWRTIYLSPRLRHENTWVRGQSLQIP